MKKRFIITILFATAIVTSCSYQKEKKTADIVSPAAEPAQTAAAVPTSIPKTAKKTTKEALGSLMDENIRAEYRSKCFSSEYDSIRHDDLSEWKDQKGNYQYPEGYMLEWGGTPVDQLASQQMPQALLDEISTEDLYELILSAPGEYGVWYNTYEIYLQMLGEYYMSYNFIEDFMEREDAPEVVHRYYKKYTDEEVEKYSKCNHSWLPKETAEQEKQGQFQLTEGLEWFFLYKEGEEVPDYQTLGSHIVEESYWDGTQWQRRSDEIAEDD